MLDRANHRAEVQAALSSLTYARQVLLQGVALLKIQTPFDEPGGGGPDGCPVFGPLPPGPPAVTDNDDRSSKLTQLAALPPTAKLTTEETAIYLNCRPQLLRTWRWQKRGPPFEGRGRFVRYTKRNLDAFMAA
jgi:hypothetical protein